MTVEVEGVRPTADARDVVLISRARDGDRDAFAQIIETRAHRLLRTARAILGNEADAYEAAQEALIAAWVNLPGLRRVDRFDAWLNRTLANKCRDALRRRARSREIELSAVDIEGADSEDARLTSVTVLGAFDRLSVDQRHILVLHHLQDLPLTQVAGQLGIPVGTAKSRLWSARRALERAMELEP
ncbi:MAG: RNA polymerase sigma factor [Chloroflexi bacterium]|nr:MAG: RNA polymerase sigma factor [Chloroflexota bacterium]